MDKKSALELRGLARVEIVGLQLVVGEVESERQDFVNELVSRDNDLYLIKNEYILNTESAIKELSYTYEFDDVRAVHCFDSSLKWVNVERSISLTAYHYLSCEIEFYDGAFLYVNSRRPFTSELVIKNGRLSLKILHDAPYLHPTWDYSEGQRISTAMATHPKGTRFLAELKLHTTKARKVQFVPSYYPIAKACIVLTDHCDFDSVEKLRLFLHGNNQDGWLGRGLKITKGVFRFGPGKGEVRKSDDLEVEEYSRLIDSLFEDGSEICPHALKHSGQLTKDAFMLGLKDLERKYNPGTWIDHGSYLKYCYSQNGHLNEDYRLLEELNAFGYCSIWSFHDIALDPTISLNFFHPKKYSYRNGLRMIMANLLRGRFFVSVHYFRSIIHKGFNDSFLVAWLRYLMGNSKEVVIVISRDPKSVFSALGRYLKRMFKFNFKRASLSVPYSLKNINALAPPVFAERHQTINNHDHGLLFFNTIETTHTKDIYTREGIEKLILQCGLHLGHTYILNALPYINGIFDKRNERLFLSREWIEFTEFLSSKITSRELWNPTMAEFTARLKKVLEVDIVHHDGGVTIENRSDTEIEDFTLVDQFDERHTVRLRPGERVKLDF